MPVIDGALVRRPGRVLRKPIAPLTWAERHPGWPLSALYLGFPLWWAMGLTQFIFLIASLPMATYLLRLRRVRVPRGAGLWLMFLLWVLVGVFVLWSTAPGTVPGGGPGRLIGFGLRTWWYFAVTIAMLYVLNHDSRSLPTLRVVRLLAYMFVITALLGLGGVLAPHFEFRSLLEIVLPNRISSRPFVHALIHPAFASTSDFLGYVHPRPIAPFPYANAWGNNLVMFLPFFVLGWMGRDAGWRRRLAPVVLVVATVPVIYSLNRGLWLAILLGALYAAVRLALNGRVWMLQALIVVSLVGGAVFVASPLYDTVTLRLETPHSNDRRSSLFHEVMSSTVDGSPIVGFGTTRQSQGSFDSIAGGETPDCPGCAPPPIGTQGFMWRLVFTTGIVGTALALAFLALQFIHHARGPTPIYVAGCVLLVQSAVTFLFYDSLGSPLFTLMLGIGLMARHRREAAPSQQEVLHMRADPRSALV